MIRQRRLVDILMVIRFANEVDYCLDDKLKENHLEQQQEADDSNHNPHRKTANNSDHDEILEDHLDRSEADPDQNEIRHRQPQFPFNQVNTLLHGLDSVRIFQNRNHARQVPDDSNIDESGEVGEEEDDRDGESGGGASQQDDPQHEESDREDVVDQNDGEAPEEGDGEALPDLGDDFHDLAEGDRLGGEDAGDGVDDGGGGEEGEDEEEGEVGSLEEPEVGPLGGDGAAEGGGVAGGEVGVGEAVFVGEDFEEDELGDLEVGEEDEGEREDEGEGYLAEDLPP